MAGMIVMADVIKLCELDASITTGGIDQTGGSNACAGGTGTPFRWMCLGFTITLFHIGLSFLDSMHLPSIQFHSICQVSSMCQLLYWVLGLHK